MARWALWIDIEGFSRIYPRDMVQALLPLRALMEGIYHLGNAVCPESPYRLFAHQIGDGFVVVSEFAERSPELPVAIGAFLQRHILLSGGMGKCAISQGDFSDIQDCYPDVICENADNSGFLRLGDGLMSIFPVMGSALINAYRLSNRESGSLLLLDSDLPGPLPSGAVASKTTNDYSVVDWVHISTPEIAEIETKTGIQHPAAANLERLLRDYVTSNSSSLLSPWITNTLTLNGC